MWVLIMSVFCQASKTVRQHVENDIKNDEIEYMFLRMTLKQHNASNDKLHRIAPLVTLEEK